MSILLLRILPAKKHMIWLTANDESRDIRDVKVLKFLTRILFSHHMIYMYYIQFNGLLVIIQITKREQNEKLSNNSSFDVEIISSLKLSQFR